jgi:hypothetical protein
MSPNCDQSFDSHILVPWEMISCDALFLSYENWDRLAPQTKMNGQAG